MAEGDKQGANTELEDHGQNTLDADEAQGSGSGGKIKGSQITGNPGHAGSGGSGGQGGGSQGGGGQGNLKGGRP